MYSTKPFLTALSAWIAEEYSRSGFGLFIALTPPIRVKDATKGSAGSCVQPLGSGVGFPSSDGLFTSGGLSKHLQGELGGRRNIAE